MGLWTWARLQKARAAAECERAVNLMFDVMAAKAFKAFNSASPMSREQEDNADFMLNIAGIFAAIVYGQPVFEKARMEGLEEMVIDQLFSYLVRDINAFVLRQLNQYAGYFGAGQREGLLGGQTKI